MASSTETNLASQARMRWLTEQLQSEGSVTITQAAADLAVSEMTIRRDLDQLEARGVARRVRGGAMPLGPQGFAERRQAHSRAKAAIAAKLAELIPTSGTVAFDASSTVMRAAATMSGARELTVLTNGPDTFQALQGRRGITPLLTGGQLDPRTGSLVGPLASWSASQLTVNRFVTSCAALDASVGATELVIEEADVKRAIAARADVTVLAADSSKFARRATAVCLDWTTIDYLVTELDDADERLDAYRELVTIV